MKTFAMYCGSIVLLVSILLVGCSKQPDAYKIGVITPLTGSRATYGAATKQGVDLAFERINKAGGIDGKKVEAIYEDSRGEPKDAGYALQKLINVDRVPVILGAFRSAETQAIAGTAESRKVVLFSASSTADEIKYVGDYIFRNVPTNSDQGKTAAHFVLEYLQKKTAAVLYQNDDYGKSLGEAFIENFSNIGGKILAQETFEGGQKDFRHALTKIKQMRPEVVFFPGNYEECALILKQARQLGIQVPFVGGDGAYSPDLFGIAGSAANGSYYTLMAMGYGVSDEEVANFLDGFKKAYGGEPDVYAAYAYDAILVIADAIKRGGYTSDGIKDALYKLEFKGVTGITKFDSYGEVSKPYYLYEAKDGKFALVTWVPTGSVTATR